MRIITSIFLFPLYLVFLLIGATLAAGACIAGVDA